MKKSKKSPQAFNSNWRDFPPDALAAVILQEQRRAVHEHFSEQEWRRLDRMRRRHAELQKELTAA